MDQKRVRVLSALLVTLLIVAGAQIGARLLFDFAPWSPIHHSKPHDHHSYLFNVLVVGTLHYFLAGFTVSLLFGRVGMRVALATCLLNAFIVDRLGVLTPREQLTQWSIMYIQVGATTLGIAVAQLIGIMWERLRRLAGSVQNKGQTDGVATP